jgi:hypothetical protein
MWVKFSCPVPRTVLVRYGRDSHGTVVDWVVSGPPLQANSGSLNVRTEKQTFAIWL